MVDGGGMLSQLSNPIGGTHSIRGKRKQFESSSIISAIAYVGNAEPEGAWLFVGTVVAEKDMDGIGLLGASEGITDGALLGKAIVPAENT
jgi:hypothetical protein